VLTSRSGIDLSDHFSDFDLTSRKAVIAAVSGGSDSTALLLLLKDHLDRIAPGTRLVAATVDHGLRPGSAAEAEKVGRLCAWLGIGHRSLVWRGPKPVTGLPAAAREARHDLLAEAARREETDLVLIAHTADDQAETVLMRLLRGSGVAGLAGIRARTPLPAPGSAELLRPLLGWRRAELRALVEVADLTPVEDPSNWDERFDRARLRRRLAEAGWLEAAPLARSASALAESDAALEWMADRLWAERASERNGGVTLDPEALPPELVRRLLLRALRRVAPAAAPRADEVGRIIESLGAGLTATLAGVKCAGGASWRFTPAPPRQRR
jgi:tRNA(Ile)-lysidine synthase